MNDAVYKAAWEARRAANAHREDRVDNATLHAGSPMYFTCPSCYGDIILPEGFLSKPRLCYDCLDLVARGLIFGPTTGTGWRWKD